MLKQNCLQPTPITWQPFILLALGMLLPIWSTFARKVTSGDDLGILIVGSITNTKPEDNVALIKETGTGKVRAVKRGFAVLSNMQVTEVTAKYILLKKGPDTILVYQNKFAAEFIGEKAAPTSSGPFVASNDHFSEDGFERKGSKVTVSSSLRDKLVNEELSKILMQATAIPKIENGEITGFRILQIDAGSIYDKAGLRDNDVVTAINGIKLNSVAGAVRLLKAMRGTNHVELEISRGGSPMKLELNVAH